MKRITIDGKNWRVHSFTPRRMMLLADQADQRASLVRWRMGQGMTQAEAADRLGITQAQLSRLESGARQMPDRLIRRLPPENTAPLSIEVSRLKSGNSGIA